MLLPAKNPATRNRKRGFTLVELAIVLGVAGLLFGGLWRILSTSNVQMRDQATANQQVQLINAVSTYLQTQNGQNLLKQVNGTVPNNSFVLALPTSATSCPTDPTTTIAGSAATETGLCSALPAGFYSGTTNPYGQQYNIRVLKDGTAVGNYPQTYSFMIMTSSGDTIPDTSGGRISAMIGGDGGFIYTAPNTCPGFDTCGSYGAWAVNSNSYFPAVGSVGHIASRTYYSPSQNFSSVWLARSLLPGDVAGASNIYNTMSTTLYMNGQTISLGIGGQIVNPNPSPPAPPASPYGNYPIELFAQSSTSNPLIDLQGQGTGNGYPVFQINNGDMAISGQITAQSFNYSSDFRLKTDIKPLNNSLGEIMELKPVSYAFKANGMKSMGVIAQDLEKIYPQLVQTDRDGIKSVAYGGLIAPLIDSVQQLKKQNDDLKKQLDEQAAHEKRMEEEIKSLRNQ